MTDVDTNGQAPQGDSDDDTVAGQTDDTVAGQTGPDEGQGEGDDTGTDDDQDQEDDGDQDAGGRGEAKQRRRAQKAERERDALADTLARTRQSIVDRAVSAAGLDPRLLTAAGHTADSLVGDDGLIDHDALADAIAATKREFRVSNGLQPNPQQGHAGGHGRAPESWSKALKGS